MKILFSRQMPGNLFFLKKQIQSAPTADYNNDTINDEPEYMMIEYHSQNHEKSCDDKQPADKFPVFTFDPMQCCGG